MKKITTTIIMLALLVSVASAFSGSGTGTTIDPYVITTCDELQEMNDDLGASYALGNDIDCSATSTWNGGRGFEPVGYYDLVWDEFPFTGSFDGQNYTITGLYENYHSYSNIYLCGLFGYALDADIRNVGIIDAYMNCSYPEEAWGSVAALVTYGEGINVENSYMIGGTYITSCESGLIGFARNGAGPSTISNIYGKDYSIEIRDAISCAHGGLVGGMIDATLTNAYASYTYTDDGSLINPFYPLGSEMGTTSVTSSYYDCEVTGFNCTGYGKTTTEMMQQATFIGWDFLNKWTIDEGTSYPYFQSQAVPNTAPVIEGFAAIGPTQSHDPETIFFSVTASDPEEDPLTYAWYVNNTLQPGEELSTFSVDVNEDVTLEVMVVVSDGELSDNSTIIFSFDLLGYEPTYTEDDVGAVVLDTSARMILGIPAEILGIIMGLAIATMVLFGIRAWSKRK